MKFNNSPPNNGLCNQTNLPYCNYITINWKDSSFVGWLLDEKVAARARSWGQELPKEGSNVGSLNIWRVSLEVPQFSGRLLQLDWVLYVLIIVHCICYVLELFMSLNCSGSLTERVLCISLPKVAERVQPLLSWPLYIPISTIQSRRPHELNLVNQSIMTS